MIRLVLLSVLSILLVTSARGASSTSSSSLPPSRGRWLASPTTHATSWSARSDAKGPDRAGTTSAATMTALGGLRGGGTVTSSLADLPVREAALHLALASWAIRGIALAARPVETMKRSGVSIGAGGPGEDITVASGWTLLSTTTLILLTKFAPNLSGNKRVVLATIPMNLYCLTKLDQLGMSLPAAATWAILDISILLVILLEVFRIPDWVLAGYFIATTAIGLVCPQVLTDVSIYKTAGDRFGFTTCCYAFSLWTAATTAVLMGPGTTGGSKYGEAVTYTLYATLALGMWSVLDGTVEKAGYSKTEQNLAILYAFGLAAILLLTT